MSYFLECNACGVGGEGMSENECWHCGSHNVKVVGKLNKWGDLIEKEDCKHDYRFYEHLDRCNPPLDVYKCTKCDDILKEVEE